MNPWTQKNNFRTDPEGNCKISTINLCVVKGFKSKTQNLQSGCKPAFNTSHAKLGVLLFFFLYYWCHVKNFSKKFSFKSVSIHYSENKQTKKKFKKILKRKKKIKIKKKRKKRDLWRSLKTRPTYTLGEIGWVKCLWHYLSSLLTDTVTQPTTRCLSLNGEARMQVKCINREKN